MTAWTDDRINLLKSEHAKGTSYGRIAVKLGDVSRSAISGMVSRLGLEKRVKPPPQVRKPRIRVQKQVFGRPEVDAMELVEFPATSADDLARDRAGLKTLVELESGDCRFPIGDDAPYLFCSLPAVNGPYCLGHAARCFNKPSGSHRPFILERVAK